jgi:hypothetical protein
VTLTERGRFLGGGVTVELLAEAAEIPVERPVRTG